MTGSTKILTVSYGTFSCTLEGFDDPFGTMRGIAEYFRDLAADDRYFGAEPPTPDVEMLQRIAEKEVQRRVEARMGEGGVALTQLTSGAPEPKAEPDEPQPGAGRAAVSREVPAEPRQQPEPEKPDLDHGPLAHDDEYLLSDEPEDVLAVDPDAHPPAEGPAETVAEKLRRIRAVVSRSIDPEDGDERRSFSAPQAPAAGDSDGAQPRDRALTETIRQITEDLSDDEDSPGMSEDDDNLFEATADTTEAAEEDDGWDIDLDTSEDAISAEAETPEDDDSWDIDLDTPTPATAEETREVPDQASDEAPDEAAKEDGDATSDDLLSRVMARKDEVKSDALRLSPESEVEPARKERRTSRPLTPISETDGDMGRLLAETDNHLNDDESVRRRRVISQMRAAVAATKADRLVSRRVTSREAEDAAEKERYRDDLNEAVGRVSQPVSPKPSSERRPSVAPLVLVSSQRVDDTGHVAPKAPEGRPSAGEIEDFAGFARDMGAKELPELLEAAAAYTAFIEGQTSFSRPEIMKRVARVDPTLKLSREDGLRSFGQLLRQGKFRKLERGQFTISDDTRFKPEQRIAGE